MDFYEFWYFKSTSEAVSCLDKRWWDNAVDELNCAKHALKLSINFFVNVGLTS
jgi:hypothetical protein